MTSLLLELRILNKKPARILKTDLITSATMEATKFLGNVNRRSKTAKMTGVYCGGPVGI